MATKHVTQLIDDIDGTVLEDGDGKRIAFSIDGRWYQIDLSGKNAANLRRAFAPYVEAARSAGSARAGQRPRAAQPMSEVDLRAVRAWARVNGHTVSDRGRVPVTVVNAYRAALA